MPEADGHVYEVKQMGGLAAGSFRPCSSDVASDLKWDLDFRSRYCQALVERTVTREIVPRLAMRHAGPWGATDVESLVWLALNKDTSAAVAYAGRALAQGLSVDALLLDLLAPAARRMGALWNDDAADFGQVTIGLSCLHQVLREVEIASEIEEGAPNQDRLLKRHALLMGTPGDQHSFGLTMVRTFFRRAGWTVWNGSTSSSGDIARIVRGHWLTVAGFSLGAEVRLDSLRRTIRTVRQASQNPRIHIMVGGPMFIEHPALVAQVGADAMAVDGRQAVMQAESLLMLPQRC